MTTRKTGKSKPKVEELELNKETVQELTESEAEAAPAEDAAAEGEAPSVQPEPKKKGKRLPRRLRPQKTRRRPHEAPARRCE